MKRYRRIAFGEIKLIFDVSREEANEMTEKLLKEGKTTKEVREKSFL